MLNSMVDQTDDILIITDILISINKNLRFINILKRIKNKVK
jgi:hypothetical protein